MSICCPRVKVILKFIIRDFPGVPVVENSPANSGHMGLIPGLGGSHMPHSRSAATEPVLWSPSNTTRKNLHTATKTSTAKMNE